MCFSGSCIVRSMFSLSSVCYNFIRVAPPLVLRRHHPRRHLRRHRRRRLHHRRHHHRWCDHRCLHDHPHPPGRHGNRKQTTDTVTCKLKAEDSHLASMAWWPQGPVDIDVRSNGAALVVLVPSGFAQLQALVLHWS